MQSEDQYLERTPDLVARIRKMRETAEKEMNKFTRVADYDIRRVTGQKPKATPVSAETVSPFPGAEHPKKPAAKSVPTQAVIDFAPGPVEQGDDRDNDT